LPRGLSWRAQGRIDLDIIDTVRVDALKGRSREFDRTPRPIATRSLSPLRLWERAADADEEDRNLGEEAQIVLQPFRGDDCLRDYAVPALGQRLQCSEVSIERASKERLVVALPETRRVAPAEVVEGAMEVRFGKDRLERLCERTLPHAGWPVQQNDAPQFWYLPLKVSASTCTGGAVCIVPFKHVD
jgi:hypothetical protein